MMSTYSQVISKYHYFKLSTIINKLTTLKIENIWLFKQVKKLKNKIENMNVMKNVDVVINYLNKNFNDKVFMYTWYIVCFH